MTFRIALSAALLALAVAVPARAETKISAYLGKSFTNDSDLHIKNPSSDLTFGGVSWDDESFTNPLYYGARVTHFLKNKPWLGFAVDFFHYKVYADTDKRVSLRGNQGGDPVGGNPVLGGYLDRFSISHGVNYLTLNAVGRLQLKKSAAFPNGRIQPYAGFGVGGVLLHPENKLKGGNYFEQYEWDGIGTQVFVGGDYYFTRRWSLFMEYKYTGKHVSVEMDRGKGDTQLDTHHLVFGASYRL